ncbi:MAG TPA: hypothetical protein ENN60_00820 [archaeon]|nr:hypothetical protein [archaeon]
MSPAIKPETCIRCKGKLWCGLPRCPVYDRVRSLKPVQFRRELEAPSPPFYMVSWKGYPQVAVGPNLSVSGGVEAEGNGGGMNQTMDEFLVGMSSQVRPYQVRAIRSTEEAALSIEPVFVNAELKHSLRIDEFDLGRTPTVLARTIRLEDTPKIPGKVFEIVDSTDLKAGEAVLDLSGHFGFDYAVRVLSTGNLGIPSERKLVPTRWAITAVDSVIAKDLFGTIRHHPEIPTYEIYEYSHWDNQFVILLVPWGWAFEMLEQWFSGSAWGGGIMQDHEYGRLKKDYASNITGAYYSARMEVLRHLAGRRKRATAIIFRRIGEGYVFPVGVWHVRECVKEALAGKPEKFGDLEGALARVGQKMGNWDSWRTRSVLLGMLKTQKRLGDYF